jgi:predicted nucleic acid-binding protein
MIVLDADHLSVFADERDARHELLNTRLEAAEAPIACAIVSVEEVLRGWLAFIHRQRDVHRQTIAYARLAKFISFLSDLRILPFDRAEAERFITLRHLQTRIGAMDLKIAASVLENKALLLTANARDFGLVPDLRCENWLE